jgi:hypothetical protein
MLPARALNSAEGAARQTLADKSRAYAIALAECCECCAAVEIAAALGACSAADEQDSSSCLRTILAMEHNGLPMEKFRAPISQSEPDPPLPKPAPAPEPDPFQSLPRF